MNTYSSATKGSQRLTFLCILGLLLTPLISPFMTTIPAYAAGTISGQAYRDHNYNGSFDGNDSGVANIVVTAYDAGNTVRGTTTTNGTGNYSLSATGSGPYRVEFTELPSYLQPGVHGSGSGTTVQFVPNGNSTGVDLALHNPADYCQANPDMALACYENGANTGSTGKGFISFPYDSRGDSDTAGYAGPSGDATIGEVGTVWGTAYQRATQRMFTASFLKRHSGLIDSPSTVYVLNYGSAAVPTSKFSLQGISPANGGIAIDLGGVCRRSSTDGTANASCGNATDNALPSDNTQPSIDLDAFDKVGKVSYGDIEIDETDNTLWLVNLNQRALISVDISNPNALPGTVNQYIIGNLNNAPSCANGVYRPWGLGFQDGLGYLGGVCTAENSGNAGNLRALVHTFDPANVTGGLTQVVDFDLDYNREKSWEATTNEQHWNPWTATWPTNIGGTRPDWGLYPQPILSDIEFAADGSMILGLMDRWGHQTAAQNYEAVSGSTDFFFAASAGDIVHLCKNGDAFVLEGTSSGGFTCAVNEPASQQPSGHIPENNGGSFETNDGPSGNGEYYANDHRKQIHTEISLGALASLKRDGTVASVVFDPWLDYDTNGIHWYNTTTGLTENAYEIVPEAAFSNGDSVPAAFGKAVGLGDLQLICDLAPIEIGNRVWLDQNGDGIQDPDEPAIEGVVVTLYNGAGTTEIATATTGADGEYYFNSSNVSGGLSPETTYQVRIDLAQTGQATNALANFVPTQNDATSSLGDGNDDMRDSDGDTAANPNFSTATITTGGPGANDHTIDFGFTQAAAIGDTVWLDTNADGIQDGDIAGAGGEDGVADVTVNLFDADDQLVDTTTTLSTGFYEFTELTPGDYYVVFDVDTLPEGSLISPQDVGGNSAASDATDSDADEDGRTATTTLLPGENDPTWDMGIYVPASIGNFVWYDANGNGTEDDETGIDGVAVELFDADDVSQGATVTAGGGFYEFIDLVPGDYYVVFTLPDGTTWTQHSVGNDDEIDSDAVPNADPATAQTETTSLDAEEDDLSWDAGVIVEAEITLEKQVQDPANGNAWVNADTTAVLYAEGTQAAYRFIITNTGTTPLLGLVLDDSTAGVTGCPAAQIVDMASVGNVLDPAESITVEPANCLSPILDANGFNNTADVSGIPSLSDGTPIEESLGLAAGTIAPVTASDPAIVGTTPLASIGNRVWFDTNKNGLQDTGESGISGVTVELLDASNAVEATVTTGNDGVYLFPGLAPGSYAVRFTLPDGVSWTLQDIGGNTATSELDDSDVDSATGETIQTTLDENETDLTWDAGVIINPSIELEKQVQDQSDPTIWHDADTTAIAYLEGTQARYRFIITNNGSTSLTSVVLDDVTPGLTGCPANLTVDLSDVAGILDPAESVTIEPGNCLSPSLSSVDFTNEATVSAVPSLVDGTPIETAFGLDAGSVPLVTADDPATVSTAALASIGDTVWFDTNKDGIQDGSEPRIDGVAVQLFDGGGNSLDSTATSNGGFYEFTQLTPGDYYVQFTLPDGTTWTEPNAGTAETADSNAVPTANPSIAQTDLTTLIASENDPTWDAGVTVDAEILLEKQVQDPADPTNWLDADTAAASYSSGEIARYRFIITNIGSSALTNIVLDDPTAGVTGCPENLAVDLSGAGGVLDPTESVVVEPENCASPVLDDGGFINEADVSGVPSLADGTTVESSLGLPAGTISPVTDTDPATVGTMPLATIGDRVWFDTDRDGIQGITEPGIANVTVALLNANGEGIQTDITDERGNYLFAGLVPDLYAVRFTLPNGTTWTSADIGENEAADSDVNPTTGETIQTTLSALETDLNWDAGIVANPSIELEKQVQDPNDPANWIDADSIPVEYPLGSQARYRFVLTNNGGTALISVVLDDPSPGVSGCPSILPVDLSDTSISNGDGILEPGESIIIAPANCLSPPIDENGFLNEATVSAIAAQDDGTQLEAALGVPPGTIPTVQDNDPAAIGDVLLAAIGDTVWLDLNADGIQDADENGLAGVQVALINESGTMIGTTTTDINGKYEFATLPPGDYSVTFTAPAGYAFSPANSGSDDSLDSDADPATGSIGAPTTLDAGENDQSWDAGLYLVSSIGDTVWLDVNGDGLQDTNEPGVADVTVQLFQQGGQEPIATMVTDDNGYYFFTDLLPGDYFIKVIPPASAAITSNDVGNNESIDSDISPTTGETIVTTLSPGENDPSWDAGLISSSDTASLGNYVWLDENADGIQDDQEVGLSGILVELYDASGTLVDTTTTDGAGLYLFSNLTPGSYYLQVARPNDELYFFSPNSATNISTNSDVNPGTGRTPVTELVPGENDVSWDAGIYAPPLLSITKQSVQTTIQPGDPINYTMTYENSGLAAAKNVFITEVIPEYTTWDQQNSSSGWSCQDNQIVANTICTYSIGDIPAQTKGSLTLTFVVLTDQFLPENATAIQNEAFISGDSENGVVLAGQGSGVINVGIVPPTALDTDKEPARGMQDHIYIPLMQ